MYAHFTFSGIPKIVVSFELRALYLKTPADYATPMNLKLIQPSVDDVTTLAEFVAEESLSETAQQLIAYQRSKGRPRNPYTRANVASQFENVFELIGGVPRLALWADQNPTQFYALFSKLLPAAIKADVSITDKTSLQTLTTEELKLMLLQSIPANEQSNG